MSRLRRWLTTCRCTGRNRAETHRAIEVVARSADDTARQTTKTASQLSRTLESEVAAVEMRTLEMARKELIEKIETLREGARSAAGKFVERLDKTDAATARSLRSKSPSSKN